MTAPVVGIVGTLEQARWSCWDLEAVLVPRNYLDAVHRAGGLALIIPPVAEIAPAAALDRVDALLLIGGADIDPASYGAAPHPETRGTKPERDAAEIALTREAWDRDMPMLGICRGMQLMNVAAGGTLAQHIEDEVGHPDHRRVLGTFDQADHDVALVPGSLAARAAGEERHPTKSHHHQGVARLGDGFEVTGRAVMDDLPEAIEARGKTWMLGVQWHPEADEASKLIAALVAETRSRASASPRGSV